MNLQASELECIFAKLTKQSSYKSTHLAMLERDDKKEQPPDKLFLWHFIKLLPIFINNFYIFFQKNVEEGWVGDCFWGTIGFFLWGREEQEGNSRRSIVFARQAPRWQQHLSLVHSQLSQNIYWLCCHCWVLNICSVHWEKFFSSKKKWFELNTWILYSCNLLHIWGGWWPSLSSKTPTLAF